MKKIYGFTLVELAISLVIIGLIVGGILTGQELIKQSEIRAGISALNEVTRGATTFLAKYSALPGDFREASNLGVDKQGGVGSSTVAVFASDTSPGNNNGNGNGKLEAEEGNPSMAAYGSYTGEIINFMIHLSNTDLIKFKYNPSGSANCDGGLGECAGVVGSDIPDFKISNTGFVSVTENSQLYYIAGVVSLTSTVGFVDSGLSGSPRRGLTPEEAYSVDSKIDDGKALTGVVKAIATYGDGMEAFLYLNSTALSSYTPVAGDECVETTDYTLTTTVPVCLLSIRAF